MAKPKKSAKDGDVYFGFRIWPDLKEAVEELAKKEGRSAGAEARIAIENHVKAAKAKA